MKKFFKSSTTYILAFILLLYVVNISFTVKAQTLDEINKQLQDTNVQKKAKESELAKAQSLLNSLKNQSYSVSSDINVIKSQISDVEGKVNQVKAQIDALNKSIQDTQAELDFQTTLREKQIREYFISSYTNDPVETILSQSSDLSNFQIVSAIQSYSMNDKKKQLDETSIKFQELSEQKKQVDSLKTQLDEQTAQLNQQRADMESRLNAIASNIGSASANASSIQSSLKNINSSLSYLNATQKKLLDAELAKMAANQQVSQTPIQDGQYFFMGRGRDLYDGHGLGMAQWGAYNMAKAGWTYDQILKFYYTGVTIGDYAEPASIVVDGKTSGPIPFDDYLAGIGEVPNSWPTESIKAQVVAARTYAMKSAYKGGDGNWHICGTDACQVYLGGTAKKDYVTATKGKVILSGGAPITAYYSANHRGCSSTLSTVWGSTDLPYIQSVKDTFSNGFMVNNAYNPSGPLVDSTNWQWRTNGYSLDQLSDILSRDSSTNVGKLQSITTSKDTCGRVAKITLVGDKGTKSMTGWTFRATFNDITPYNDYVYSTEFNFYRK